MFLLKKRESDCVDCDDFGWWLTGSKPEAQIHNEEVLTSDGICSGGSTQSIIPDVDPDDQNSFVLVQDPLAAIREEEKNFFASSEDTFSPKTEDENTEEICTAEEPPCKTSSRSYTPERLIRTEDYTILTKSPTFSCTPRTEPSTPIATPFKQYSNKRHRGISNLIDKKHVGAAQLEALFDSDALDIKLPVASARRKTLKKHSSLKENSNSGDLLAIANSESPRRSLTPDLMSSGSSCERSNFEWKRDCDSERVIGDDNLFGIEQLRPFKDLKTAFSVGEKSIQDLLQDKISTEDSWSPGFIPKAEEDPEIVVDRLRERIESIREMNRDIFVDLSSLRTNFQWEETKTGNLTTETTRLRQEIRDLRYLDDLVNLLRGELERISRRNWPFNLGHTDHQSEEVNLVV